LEYRSDMKRFKKTLYIFLAATVLGMSAVILFSPYGNHPGFDYKLVLHSVEINAPPDSVFRFLGNSANASKWSVFVHHISPLNPDSFPDGTPGSRRRCYCQADEKGTRWDEVLTEVVPGKKRQILCYNLVDFTMTANDLATEQLYEPLGGNKCKLTFTVFYRHNQPTLWESIKTYLSAYKMKSIFEDNMNNIKRIVETGQ
jgi:hypothetical protein